MSEVHEDARSHLAVLIVGGEGQETQIDIAEALQTLDADIIELDTVEQAVEIAQSQREICGVVVASTVEPTTANTLVTQLHELPQRSRTPILLLGDHDQKEIDAWSRGEHGAVDLLSAEAAPSILRGKVKIWVDFCRQRQQLEHLIHQLNYANAALSKQTLRLEISSMVGHQIASILNLDELLIEIVSSIRERFGFFFVGVWMLSSDRQAITLRAGQYGTPRPSREPGPAISVDAPRSIIAHVCRTQQPYLASDVEEDPLYLATDSLPTIRSEIALPLKRSTTFLGVLDIQSERVDAFASEDVLALTNLAQQISVAIRNANLYAEVRALNEELETQVDERTEELEKAYQQLKLLERNKTDFLTVVSHELRTPLTLVEGFSKLLVEDPETQVDPIRQQLVEGIVNGADRLRSIVSSILETMHIDSRTLELEPEQLSLWQVLEAETEKLAPTLEERRLTLRLRGLSRLPQIEADRTLLSRVFEELLTNAIKYTPDHGRITVTGRRLVRQPENGGNGRGYVEVTISDTGIGISPELQELIFAKFYRAGDVTLHTSSRTKFKGGGPGLGLAIARGLVEAHGGHIWAESPGYDEVTLPGSDFHVVLPITQPDHETAQVAWCEDPTDVPNGGD